MTLICPRCFGKDIDYRGVPGTQDPRYECKTCGYAGPLVIEQEESGEKDESAEEQDAGGLLCPNCGSEDIANTIPDNAQGSFQPRYACRKCGYNGSTALKKDKIANETSTFPYMEIMVFFFLSIIWYLIGAGLDYALLFFAAPTAVIVFFRYLLGGEHTYSVEDDLKNLNVDGLPRRVKP